MIFIQQFILWGLPLALLPLVIHLLNRLRFRSVAWAAMVFLLTATRESTRHARVKQWLVLACRMAAVALLVFALSRPLAGGWLGGVLGGQPETVLLVVDRSASMGTMDEQAQSSRLQRAVSMVIASARQSGAARFVVIDNVTMIAYDVAGVEELSRLPLSTPTDTASDISAMVEAALVFLQEERTGPTELWVISDLQESNWGSAGTRWEELSTRLQALPQDVRVRILAADSGDEGASNLSVRVEQVTTYTRQDTRRLSLTLVVRGNYQDASDLPLRFNLNGNESRLPISFNGGELRLQHTVNLGDRSEGGWGCFSLPADANRLDNQAWFVYGQEVDAGVTVVAESAAAKGFLQAACEAASPSQDSVRVVDVSELKTLDVSKSALVVWQGAMPTGETHDTLTHFVEEGGAIAFFAGNGPASTWEDEFAGFRWFYGLTEANDGFGIGEWNETDGPLARTLAGESLPVDSLVIRKQRDIIGSGQNLAYYDDGRAWMIWRQFGRGKVLICGTSPEPEWSTLTDGMVLVPMLQRLLIQGEGWLAGVENGYCGREKSAEGGKWLTLDGSTARNPVEQAGAYSHDRRLVALNRPPVEDRAAHLTLEDASARFGDVPLHTFKLEATQNSGLPSELWRILVILMLIVLTCEALLVQPSVQRRATA